MALKTFTKDVALGSQSGVTGTLRLVVNEDSIDTSTNKSSCSYHLYLIVTGSWRASSGSWSLTGDKVKSGNIASMTYYSGTTELANGTFTKSHAANGTGSLSVGMSFTSTFLFNGSGTLTGTLTTIPRASEPTASTGNIGGSLTIYTNRKSTSFTHTLTYTFGSLTGTIATGVGDNYVWTVPSNFYSQIPNNTEGTGIITCTTYNGSTSLGSKTCNFKVYAVKSDVNPQVSVIAIDTNKSLDTGVHIQDITGDTTNKTIIKGMSDVEVSLTATPRGSSSITATQISSGDGEYQNGTGNMTKTFTNVSTNSFTGKAVDTRGYDGYGYVNDLTLLDYIVLSISPVILYRANQTSNDLYAQVNGNYFNGNIGNTANTIVVSFKYKESTNNWTGLEEWTPITPNILNNEYDFDGLIGSNFDYTKIYDFVFKVEDALNIKTFSVSSTPGIPTLALFEKSIEMFGEKVFYID